MNSNMLFMLALMGGNTSISPQFIQALQDAQKDSFERWSKMLKSLAAIITTGIFFLRGMPAPVDSSGAPVFTNEALSKQISASFTEGKREAFWVALVNGVVDALLEFMRPSTVQQALMMSLLNKGTTASTTVITQPVPVGTLPQIGGTQTMVTRTAGQVLRQGTFGQPTGNFMRAQAVYFNPQTGEIAVE
ncbi:MAG TPA: hypothetical protein DCQ33_14970 [Nitrospira sp.]|nr:hypothetical protein [Nitrospira sp.]